jgi:hypothetical protein
VNQCENQVVRDEWIEKRKPQEEGCSRRNARLAILAILETRSSVQPPTAGIHHAFSNPEQLALWIKSRLSELVQTIIDDVNKGRFFAYLTRWRQPEEMYHRDLCMLFVADKSELPHIASWELPMLPSWLRVGA